MATIKTKGKVDDKVTFYCDDVDKELEGVITEVNATISKNKKDIWYRIQGPIHKSSDEYCIEEENLVIINNKLV